MSINHILKGVRNNPCVHLYAYTILLNVRLINFFYILFEVMSCNLSFIIYHPIICKTVQYIEQS